MEIFLIICSSMATICILASIGCSALFVVAKNQYLKAKKIASDLATAHNANQETIQNLIAKISDLEMQIAMNRRDKFRG